MFLLSAASPAFEPSPLIRLVQAPKKKNPELSHFRSQQRANTIYNANKKEKKNTGRDYKKPSWEEYQLIADQKKSPCHSAKA